ncbi:DUF2214 domain-containing protein [Halopseudomonas pelagia]|uniref:DUF2214 domain-containing protein n=1 Tax=Halopseudomonas pelagia TaxID=553151 RepID=A0AA91U4G6_9GAMM|nr:DUF2214 domain-containing protein [Halopseudomonas pelagia]PCD00408.1 DUF2214 domain-containing protein [Halopseudomonas pelagia]QFY55111.1 DUF2214 domain-containing protein [Halopseudomonas pelagia]
MDDSLWTALTALPPAVWLRDYFLAYLLVNAAHIAGLGMLLGSIITLDLRLLGLFRQAPLQPLAHVLSRTAASGLALAIFTGIWLFLVNAPEYVNNSAFLSKLLLVSLAIANATFLHSRRHWRLALQEGRANLPVRIHALISLLLWPAALVAGRWIGFL